LKERGPREAKRETPTREEPASAFLKENLVAAGLRGLGHEAVQLLHVLFDSGTHLLEVLPRGALDDGRRATSTRTISLPSLSETVARAAVDGLGEGARLTHARGELVLRHLPLEVPFTKLLMALAIFWASKPAFGSGN
jgi:hypothetical protein